MTPTLRRNVLLGLTAIIGIVGSVFIFQFVAGRLASGRTLNVTAVFKDAHGLQEAGEVRMAGVQVGRITTITLNAESEAEVNVRLTDKYPVPKNSRFVVTGSVLGNSSLLNIMPGTSAAPPLVDGDRVRGESSGDFQSLLASGETLVPELQKTLPELRKVLVESQKTLAESSKALHNLNGAREQKALRDTLAHIDGITGNLERTTNSLPRLTQNAEGQLNALSGQSRKLLSDLDDAALSGKQIAKNGEALTANLNGTLADNRQNLKSLLESADESASALAGLLKQAGGLLGDPELKKNLTATTANLAETTARLEAVTANIEKLSGDPRLAADLRDTVANLKDTTESVKNLAARVETIRIPGEKRKPGASDPLPAPPKPAAATSLIEPGLAFDSFYDTTNPRFRADASYTLRFGGDGRFYRAGLADVTERNGLNLQAGQSFGRNGGTDFAYRYGLIGGKFGVGFDANAGLFDFRLDAFDPNRFSGNARAKLYLNRERTQSLLFGLEDLARDNRATIGVQIRQ